jgi:PhnB protein
MPTPAPTPAYRTITPYLVVRDATIELRFLQDAFGGTETEIHRHDDGTIQHAEVRIGDSLLMLGQCPAPGTERDAAIYLWVDDVDATYAKALASGAASESVPEDKPYGHRNAGVTDVNGITWWIGSPVKAG